MTFWPELVELFEYKVADLVAGRVPRGGRRSLLNLRSDLLTAELEPPLQRRLIEADRQFRTYTKTGLAPQTSTTVVQRAIPAAAWQAPVTARPDEALAWEELQRLAWHDRLVTEVQGLIAAWSRELNLISLRVLYTATENAERLLHAGQEPLAVPTSNDPLVSLLDRTVQEHLTQTVAALLSSRDGEVRLRAALSELHETPFPRHPDEDVLTARIEAANRERLTAEERAALVRALQDQYPLPRDPRERPAIREAVRALGQKLEPLLAGAPRSTLGTVPHHSVLYAPQPELALGVADDAADELVVYLPGGQAARWRGVDWRWQFIAPQWQLLAGSHVALLRPLDPPAGRRVRLDTPQGTFKVFVSGQYALLRAEVKPEEELGRRAAVGRTVALLLEPSGEYAFLRLARATAQLLRDGRVDPQALGPRSAERYKVATQPALLTFARRGVTTLLARLAALSPEEVTRHVQDAGRALGLSAERGVRLTESLHAAMHRPEPLPVPVSTTQLDVPLDGRLVSVQLLDEPLTLLVGGRALTLRQDFQGRLAAVLPGFAAQYLQDLLVVRLQDLSVVLARHGRWLTAAAELDSPDVTGAGDLPTLLVDG
ncbi:hypothetical protein HNQ07_003772 [Deinococcus metalli]|uniref:Uncharacterized protein n=1 Tax=Deinococcus metalli TaxID=1141878 RepID=A0A7W8KJT8_9DEIO|nr:hypothetical protein [Deinococcus metalli]MBB5378271.1 hypothetical protein [Deinococcus metalli]GHF57328.1 hypothetical protein GCM10017781_37100 [Deinococcus metalli]